MPTPYCKSTSNLSANIFLDPKMKLFGVLFTILVLMGALVGGVVGVLLPKISTGISLGVLTSLYFGVVRQEVKSIPIILYYLPEQKSISIMSYPCQICSILIFNTIMFLLFNRLFMALILAGTQYQLSSPSFYLLSWSLDQCL